MNNILLSITIPTFNRANFLKLNLEQLKLELLEIDKNQVEIIVSDNCSDDNTQEIVQTAIKQGLTIKYVCNTSNLGWGKNFIQCFDLAKGKYVLILGDDDFLYDGSLKVIMSYLSNKDYGLICLKAYGFNTDFRKEYPGNFGKISEYKNKQDFFLTIGASISLISSCIINKDLIKDIDTQKMHTSNFAHLHLSIKAILASEKNLNIKKYFIACKRNNSSNYSFSKVFVEEFWQLLDSYDSEGLKKETIDKLEKKLLFSYYPLYLLKERLNGTNNYKTSLKHFSDRFGKMLFFKIWVLPILKFPRPLAIFWGGLTTFIGRIFTGDLIRGIVFMWRTLLNL
jgi:abequosyltransferase